MSRKQSLKHEARRIPLVEWLMAGVGVALLAGVLVVVLLREQRANGAPPAIELRVTATQRAGTRWLVRFEAVNTGDDSAADVEIVGELATGDSVLEESRAVMDYLPSRAPRRGGLYFSRDPRSASLTLRPAGYRSP